MSQAIAGPVIQGERVRLRPASDDDAPDFVRWSNDPEFAWYQWGRRPGRFPDEEAFLTWARFFSERSGQLLVIEHEGRPIGFANYRDWRPKPRSCEIGIGIGEASLRSKGLGRDALRALLRFLVDELGAHRVALSVLAFNDRAISSYKACGFEVEGVEKDGVLTDDGRYVDDVRMAFIAGRALAAFDPRPVVLEGRHVRLEPLRMEHAAELLEAVREPEIWRWLNGPPPTAVGQVEDYIRGALDLVIRGEHVAWLTRRASDGLAVGSTRYGAIDRANRSVEIGWTMLSAAARRTALNTEAKYLQLRHAFDALGASRVWLKTDALNVRSRQAIQRIGAKAEGVIRNERIMWDGRVRDAAYYSVVAQEWPAARTHLESLLARP